MPRYAVCYGYPLHRRTRSATYARQVLGRGHGHTLLHTIHIDGVLLVTTPQDLSLMDTGRSLGVFRQAGIPIVGVIENMSFLHCPHCGEPVEVFCRSEREWAVEAPDLTLLGRIPMHRAISRGIDAGHPCMQAVPNTPEARAFLHIATQVCRMFRA